LKIPKQRVDPKESGGSISFEEEASFGVHDEVESERERPQGRRPRGHGRARPVYPRDSFQQALSPHLQGACSGVQAQAPAYLIRQFLDATQDARRLTEPRAVGFEPNAHPVRANHAVGDFSGHLPPTGELGLVKGHFVHP